LVAPHLVSRNLARKRPLRIDLSRTGRDGKKQTNRYRIQAERSSNQNIVLEGF
jgi:hypothetical protein